VIPEPTGIGYVPALAVACCCAFVVAIVAARTPISVVPARAAAGGGILAILVTDLLPGALADAREQGIALWMVGLLVWGTFGLARAARAGTRHALPGAAPALLSAHGLVEGAVAGASTGVNVVLGLSAVVSIALHKAFEGVDLALYLRAEGARARPAPWLAMNAAAPIAGVLIAHVLVLPSIPIVVAMSMVAGLLLHVVFQICLDQLAAQTPRGAWLAFATAFVVIVSVTELATRLRG
jgi:zinc transporter ZupT